MLLASLASCAAAKGLNDDEYALWLAPVEGGEPILTHRADLALNPASTMKLLTSWAALKQLGPDYRWRTRFVSSAPLVNGVLKGDLVWIGAGDPRFTGDDLLSMLRDLRRRGLREIEGRLVLDKSEFNYSGSADDFSGDAERSFTTAPDAHLTGLKVAWLQFYNDSNGPRAVLDPALPGVSIKADLRDGGSAACPDVRQAVAISPPRDGRVYVSGALPRACDGARAYVNVLSAGEFAAQSFQALWRELGGVGPASWGHGRALPDAQLLAQHDSPPLMSVLQDINKYSNNTMARMLYLTLGAGQGDATAGAEHAVRLALRQNGLSDQSLVLENGSGLSRRERISARVLGEVLRDSARGPYAAELAVSLPLAGADGTLKRRLEEWGARLRLKTGSLANVQALAGYWSTPDGRRYVLVAIVNSPRARELKEALDQLVSTALSKVGASGTGPL
jgi:D-alanyl-D-alanine carboxypeptidase/D-alanyl-D-alanine-endopeptidase (penicillin-binding protein 4)